MKRLLQIKCHCEHGRSTQNWLAAASVDLNENEWRMTEIEIIQTPDGKLRVRTESEKGTDAKTRKTQRTKFHKTIT